MITADTAIQALWDLWRSLEHPVVYAIIGLVAALCVALYRYWTRDSMDTVKVFWLLIQPADPKAGRERDMVVLRSEEFASLLDLFRKDWWLRWRLKKAARNYIMGIPKNDFLPKRHGVERLLTELSNHLSARRLVWLRDAIGALAGTVKLVHTCENQVLLGSDRCQRGVLISPEVWDALFKLDPAMVGYEKDNHAELVARLVRMRQAYENDSRVRKLAPVIEVHVRG